MKPCLAVQKKYWVVPNNASGTEDTEGREIRGGGFFL